MLSALRQFMADPPCENERARALFEQHRRQIAVRTDRIFAGLMAVQWIGGIILAVVVSPRTWSGATPSIHVHVWSAVLCGGVLSAAPIWMALRHPGLPLTRHVIAISQMLWSGLLIHLTGGRIETHFHVFGSLAFLSFYRDWKVLIPATIVVAMDHLVRGIFWPQSVFGVLAASPWRTLEHTAWVIFEDIVLVLSCRQCAQEMVQVAEQRARLERTRDVVESEVHERTRELVTMNERLERTQVSALASARAKTEFLANMSHEIRTPMTAILGFSENILDDTLCEEERKQALQTIHNNGRYLLEIINDILDLSKIEAGKMTVENRPCATTEIISDVRDLISIRSDAKGLAFEVECVGMLPQIIKTDPTRLRQILINLLGNAIKFTEVGSVRLIVRLVSDNDPPLIQFDVLDSGIGMTEDQLKHLFNPFTQADTSTTRRFGGTGLGLAISRRFAQMLGGNVEVVESVPGTGTRFRLTVSSGSIIENEEQAKLVTQSHLDTSQTPGNPQARLDCRVLLAEDGPDNQRLIGHILTRRGAEVTIVENGQLAVEQALAAEDTPTSFDIILMDMQMPVLDGYQATALLRERHYSGPILALTAHAMAGDRNKCLAAGCDDYVTKPIDRDRLIAVVHQYTQLATGTPPRK